MSGQVKLGRPSRYSNQLATAILERLADGELMIDILKSEGMPHHKTIYRWTEASPEFRAMFAHAREVQAHTIAEKGIKIALGATQETANADRLKFDGYRWFASKLLPKVYGDKLLHTGGDGEGPIAVKVKHDYSLLTGPEMVQLLALLEKCTPKQAAIEGPTIEGDATEVE